jgi:hypothetical protein
MMTVNLSRGMVFYSLSYLFKMTETWLVPNEMDSAINFHNQGIPKKHYKKMTMLWNHGIVCETK